MEDNENIFRPRFDQAKNMWRWLGWSFLLFIVWAMFFINTLEVFDLISIKRTSAGAGGTHFGDVLVFIFVSFLGYLWRYTLPKSVYCYKKVMGKAMLSLKGHMIANMVTIMLFSFTLYWTWGEFVE